MKIKLNDDFICEIEDSPYIETMIKDNKIVSCWQIKCLGTDIHCSDCKFYPSLYAPLNEVLVSE